MTPGDAALAGEMVLRGLVRRRLSLALLVALPLVFFVARHEHVGQSIRFLVLGVAWAVSTVAFFAAVAGRQVERQLGVAGWSWQSLVAGRIGALLGSGLALAGGYMLLVAVDQPVRSNAGVGLDLATTTLVAVVLGSFLGTIAARELEGALLLFMVAGLQFMVDPASGIARLLPFWSSRELATYALDGPQAGDLASSLLHAALTVAVLAAGTVWMSSKRLRVGPRHRAQEVLR
jgi:hypothetical protein